MRWALDAQQECNHHVLPEGRRENSYQAAYPIPFVGLDEVGLAEEPYMVADTVSGGDRLRYLGCKAEGLLK